MRKRKSHFFITTMSALALSAGLTFGQSGKKETMAVMEVEALPELGKKMEVKGKTLELKQVLGALNGAINQSFSATDKFTVVIRKNLKKFLEELALNGGGAEFTGAKYLVVTTLDNFEDNTARSALETGQLAMGNGGRGELCGTARSRWRLWLWHL